MNGEDTTPASAKLTEAGDGVGRRRRADHASTLLVRTADVGRIADGNLLSADLDDRPLDYASNGTVRSWARWALWPRERPGTAGTAVMKDIAPNGAGHPGGPCPPMQPGGAHEGKMPGWMRRDERPGGTFVTTPTPVPMRA